nr:MAG TPA: hypothetical protein [Caudoviricetes sp.]
MLFIIKKYSYFNKNHLELNIIMLYWLGIFLI